MVQKNLFNTKSIVDIETELSCIYGSSIIIV